MSHPIQKLLFAFCLVVVAGGSAVGDEVLLFPTFDSNGENGVFLLWSEDGLTFHSANEGRPIFTPPQWEEGQHLTRDPSIVYRDGLFHMVWTTNWNGRWLGYASSPDLKEWSEPRQVQPFPEGKEQPKNVWAPEVFWDHVAGDYKIVWSSTLPSELADGDGSEDTHGYDHRMYYVSTSDFETFTEPALLFEDLGYSVIDAQVAWDPAGERWVMTLKKEVPPSEGGKNIRLAFSAAEITPESFGDPTEPVVGLGTSIVGRDGAEGATLLRWNDQWRLYWDSYGARHYSMASSDDLSEWTDRTKELRFPTGHPRHGTMLRAERGLVSPELIPRPE